MIKKITNNKHQTSNKSQIPSIKCQMQKFGILVIGYWNLFEIWDLLFGVSEINVMQFSKQETYIS
jgi:hypothetical protein